VTPLSKIAETEEVIIARQWFGTHILAMDMHTAIQELLEVVFYMWSMPKLYNDCITSEWWWG
jgi:hypothetical protein